MDRYLSALKNTTDRQDRQDLEFAMLLFRDPAASNSGMQAVLAGEIPMMEAGGYLLVFGGQAAGATN